MIVLSACSGSKVITLVGPDARFQNYFTYRIEHPRYPEDSVPTEATILRERIDKAISTQMDARGYNKTNPADIVVNYKMIFENKVDIDVNDPYRNRYNYNRSPYGYRYNYPYVTERAYTEGTLLIEIREDFGNAVVWDGSLDMKTTGKKTADPVIDAFHLILAEYNYRAGEAKPVVE